MRPARFVSTSKLLVMLTLAGFVLGCGEQGGTGTVPTPEKSKQIAAEMKKSMQEFKAARQGAKGRGSP
jgi:hypothetical protein